MLEFPLPPHNFELPTPNSQLPTPNSQLRPPPPMLITLIGPTAVGKTELSLRLAQEMEGAIVIGDPRQMYRGLNLGTAKPTPDELAQAPHFLVDSLEPEIEINAAQFADQVEALLSELMEQYRCVILVGGATLYMDAIWYQLDEMPEVPEVVRESLNLAFQAEGLGPLLDELEEVDPETFAQIDRHNHVRVIRALEVYRASGKPISAFRQGRKAKEHPWPVLKIGLQEERAVLYERIDQRVLAMIDAGLEDEVRALRKRGLGFKSQAMRSIGYQEWEAFFQGKIDREEVIRLIQRNSRRYAKRQLTYWQRYDDIQWFGRNEKLKALEFCKKRL